jgi:hypothetical protein
MNADLFKKDPRDYALEMVEQGLVSSDHLLLCALKYMSCDDVRDMLDCNELSPRFDEDEAEDEVEDSAYHSNHHDTVHCPNHCYWNEDRTHRVFEDNGEHICAECAMTGRVPNPEGPQRFDLVHKDGYALRHKWL